MISFNTPPQEQLLPRLQVIVYSLVAFALLLLIYDQYRQGLYSLVLANAISIPAFLFSAAYIYINRDRDSFLWVNYPLVAALAGLALVQLPRYPDLMIHYLFAMPMFTYFCLPMQHATVVNILVASAMGVILWGKVDVQTAVRYTTNFSLLVLSTWCFSYLTLLKGASLQRLALTDQVSGAYNREHFYHLLERELARGEATRQSVSMIGIVLDDYRQLIDLHGNRSVVQFMPQFVKKIRQLIRGEDDIFRLEDDLIMLVLPNCGEEGAIVLMERIKRKVQEQSWKPFAEVSISIAAVTRNADEDSESIEKRLLKRLNKQQKTSLQLAAFSD
ncbi:MAG: diguanylate cyclase [Pseudomonadota bacterium]|nr:diguanylate cyclase [Pseudomonadota bacterium]